MDEINKEEEYEKINKVDFDNSDEKKIWRIYPYSLNDKDAFEKRWESFKKDSYIGIGFSLDNVNLNDFSSREELKKYLINTNGQKSSSFLKVIWDFAKNINKHDIIIASGEKNEILGIGEVNSDYISPNDPQNPSFNKEGYKQIRKVNWTTIKRKNLSFKYKKNYRSTLEEIDLDTWKKIKKEYCDNYYKESFNMASPEIDIKTEFINWFFKNASKGYQIYFGYKIENLENKIDIIENKYYDSFKKKLFNININHISTEIDSIQKNLKNKNNVNDKSFQEYNDKQDGTPNAIINTHYTNFLKKTDFINFLSKNIQDHSPSYQRFIGSKKFDAIEELDNAYFDSFGSRLFDININNIPEEVKIIKNNLSKKDSVENKTFSEYNSKIGNGVPNSIVNKYYIEFLEKVSEEGYNKKIKDDSNFDNADQMILDDSKSNYTKEDFLNDVVFVEKEYDELVKLIKRKKNIILQGSPGVGKTFIAKRLAYSMMGLKDENRVEFVQFHQSYSYEDFILGYRPTKEGFELKNGVFYNFCMKAINNPEHEYFFIIDEINRGNISKIFGEVMMLIEEDKRCKDFAIQLTYSDIEDFNIHSNDEDSYNDVSDNDDFNNEDVDKDNLSQDKFHVPENLYIIGMMNTADRSLAIIDYALRRRFVFYTVNPLFDEDDKNDYIFKKYLIRNGVDEDLAIEIIRKFKDLNNFILNDEDLGDGFKIGHSYFCVDDVNNQYGSIVEYEIAPLLREYWFDNLEEAEKRIKHLIEDNG
ncbi:MAG: AAA family ATPase [Methanobrevibacter sp.]|nr:AAA family ATPase [Candidatus Methanovirga australis]